MKRLYSLPFLAIFLAIFFVPFNTFADSDILSKEENLWLKSRNNTIVVYPEKNYPPYSYQNTSGIPQGLSIDFIELIAQKLGIRIEYLPARPLSQILDDAKHSNKADVITSLTQTKEREDFLYFSDFYINSPAVIVVRKDRGGKSNMILSDLTGERVAIGSKYAVEEFVRTNNPRVIIEPVTDDETGLQQLVLGEVDAAIMDVTSLSYYLSKQVLNSVKVVGSTGFEYKLSFAVPKDKEILQSILDKGLQQVGKNDRKIITDKWVTFANDIKQENPVISYINKNFNIIILYLLLIFIIILLVRKNKGHFLFGHHRKINPASKLKEEILQLEDASKELIDELEDVKNLENELKERVRKIETE
jgi:ABC-type amino acid transport substrate-binding protein